ncbi:hypothetical protein BGZ81_001749, partial [Podila clonocystis]
KRARKYHEEAIQRRKDKESKRQSASHDQLRQVLESNKAFRAKVRALERGQIESEREQREELVHLTGLVEQMVAQVGEMTSTATTKKSEQDATPRRRGIEQTKTPVSGTSPTLILSPQEIQPQVGKEEGALSLKSLQVQKCHMTLLQLQTLMDQLPKALALVTEMFRGNGVDFDGDEAHKQRRRIKRQSGSSASSGETLVVSLATTRRKHIMEEQDHEHEPSVLARQLLVEQHCRHRMEIERIKQQCVSLYRASLAEVRAEMKGKLAKMKKTSLPSFGH